MAVLANVRRSRVGFASGAIATLVMAARTANPTDVQKPAVAVYRIAAVETLVYSIAIRNQSVARLTCAPPTVRKPLPPLLAAVTGPTAVKTVAQDAPAPVVEIGGALDTIGAKRGAPMVVLVVLVGEVASKEPPLVTQLITVWGTPAASARVA